MKDPLRRASAVHVRKTKHLFVNFRLPGVVLMSCAFVSVLSGCGGGGSGSSSSNAPLNSDAQLSVVFQSNRDGDFEILRMNGDGSAIERITGNVGNDISPSYTSDRKRIVFVSARTGKDEIFVVDSQGTQQLTSDGFPKFQPIFDVIGENVLYRSNKKGEPDLFSIDINSKKEIQVTKNSLVEQDASFSSNGEIYFTSISSGNYYQIFSISSSGDNLKQLTFDERDHLYPRISRDQTKILFSSKRQSDLNIYLLDRSSGVVQELTKNAKNNVEPIFSPDGKRIFFSSNRTGNYDIYSMNLDGSGVRNLTNNPGSDRAPSVQ